MPIVTTHTTTTRSSRITTSTIPVWLVKLITVILCLIVLFLIYLQHFNFREYYSKTFITLALTCGALLGWSIGSVLQQIFSIRHVEITVNLILSILSVISALFCISYIMNTNDYYSSNSFKMMTVTAVCFIIQSVVCITMLSWAWYGNIIIVRHV